MFWAIIRMMPDYHFFVTEGAEVDVRGCTESEELRRTFPHREFAPTLLGTTFRRHDPFID